MTWQVPGYEQVRPLGDGATGVVVLARHDETGTLVAIKYLSDGLRADIDGLAAFRGEARLLAGLDDPNLVQLYEYVECDLGAAIVMELVNGPSLRVLLRELGPTEPEAAIAILKGSLLGLAAAHAVGVVHRDYKPENVIVDGAGQSKLADFGIAVPAGTAGATTAGTPRYLAPESWRDGTPTPAADVYAAAATFFECLTGQPPFTATAPAALRLQHANAPIPSAEVPKPLQDIVRRGLAKDPAVRPRDAARFAAELDAVAVAAYGAEWEESGRRHLARRAALLSLLWPLSAGVAATAVARTLLGRSGRTWIVGAIAAAILIIGIGAAAREPNNTPRAEARPAVTTTPTARATSTPASTPSASRRARPSARPTTTRSRSVGRSTPAPRVSPTTTPTTRTPASRTPGPTRSTFTPVPPPPPPPPPRQTIKVTIVYFAWDFGMTAKATVTVNTATTAPVSLTLRYYESKTVDQPQSLSGSTVHALSGARTYTITETHPFSACTAYWVLQAVTVPAAANGTQTASTIPDATC
jgi:serine/threonine-protein kinase